MYPETWEAQLLQPAGGERGKREGRTGVDATRQLPVHAWALFPGQDSSEAKRTASGCRNDLPAGTRGYWHRRPRPSCWISRKCLLKWHFASPSRGSSCLF